MRAGGGVEADAHELSTVVPTEMGDLSAILRVPDGAPLPGLVLVGGSGDGDRDGWGDRARWLADAGAVALRHDRPGCGGSPGDWRAQTLEARVRETPAAVRALRGRPATSGQPIGLYGAIEGGWVALLAARMDPSSVDFVVAQSAPGTTPEAQERDRLERTVRAAGFDGHHLAAAMAWVDERARLVRSDVPISDLLAVQQGRSVEPWFAATLLPYDDAPSLQLMRGMRGFDPVTVLPHVHCPVLVLLGAADSTVPVRASVAAYTRLLPRDPRSGIVVLPGADHDLFVGEPCPDIPRASQLAPGYLPLVAAFLADRRT